MRRILISLFLVAGWLASPVPAQTTGGYIRKFFGSGTPGSIVASRWGDIYINTATSTAYICSDTVAFCSGVASGEWVAAASSGGTGDVQGGSSLTTAGAIPFVASSSTLTQNGTRLFWDNTNFRLGINTATPSQSLHVVGTALFSDKVTFTPNATNAGMNVGSYTGTPTFPVNGDMWYDPTLNKFRCYENSTTANCIGAGGGGTVTSVGLSLPSFISVSGSPVTGSGTLTGTLASQSANLIFASPDGAAGAPTFRSFALGDVAANLLTFAKLQQIGTNTIVCNSTGGTANMSACSTATVLTMLSLDNVVKNNQANTYSGGGLQDMSAMKVKPGTTTVASLPTASSNSGVVYLVTDGTSLTDCATGGGSTRTWCVSNGTSWNAMTASSTGLGDPGSNSVPYRNGSGTTTPATATEMSSQMYCADAGASDAYACNLSPALTSYVAGTIFRFKANTANTGASSINFNGLGAKTIKRIYPNGSQLDTITGDIDANEIVTVVYNGTDMLLVGARRFLRTTVANATSAWIGNNSTETIIAVSDGATSTDCVVGGGSFTVICHNVGGVWRGVGTLDSATLESAPTNVVYGASTTITNNLLVTKDSLVDFRYALATTTPSTNVAGVVISGCAGTVCAIQVGGVASCVADNTATRGNLVGVGTTTAGRCKDLGTTDINAVASTLQVVGVWETSVVSAGTTGNVLLFGSRIFGRQNLVLNNQANTYSGGGLQDLSAMKVKPGATTIGSLPTASSNGNVVYLVTDATGLTDCTVGGGSTRAWCVSNGTSWVAMTASGTGLGDPGANGIVYRNGSGTSTTASATEMSGPFFCQDAGASDTYACSLSPAPSSYVTGTVYWFKANTANTGAATINFNSLGAKTIKKVAGGITTDLADNDIRAGQWVLVSYDGTNMQMMSMLGNAASGSDIQIFTSSGTWTKPAACTSVIVTLIGGGGGGGSGRRGAAASNRASGAGGGGGAKSTATIQCSALASTVSVTVATGGAGGAAVTANDTNGNNGSNGTTTTFGSHLRAGGGALGAGGATGASAGGSGGVGELDGTAGANGGTGAGSNAIAASGAGGGGGGGGITSGDTAAAGGNGAIGKALTTLNSAGGSTCANGTAATAATTNTAVAGVGGAGGGGCTSGVAGNGANGGNYGGGGGGGGASVNGNNSGAGGNGGDGIAIVVTIP